MSSVAELFVQLRVAEESVGGGGLRALPTGLKVNSEDVFVAVDSSTRRHLLVPVDMDVTIPADDRSQGVRLGTTELQLPSGLVRFADLECRDAKLSLVFERLVEDVLLRLEESGDGPLVITRVLDEWRDLLRTARSPLERETSLGLHGELEVLSRLGRQHPAAALTAWVGPQGRPQDFVREESAIEVKATASVDGNSIQVSNLDQLDPSLHGRLHLVVVHLREAPTAPSLDDRIEGLLNSGFPRAELLAAVEDAGYVFESGGAASFRFETRSVRAWPVTDDFPGLRASDLAARRRRGVSRVRYELALDVAAAPMRQAESAAFLESWVQ